MNTSPLIFSYSVNIINNKYISIIIINDNSYHYKVINSRRILQLLLNLGMIEKELREAWREINVTVKEGVEELTTINAIEMEVKGIKYNQIPEPRELGIKLIKALGLSMPVAIENKGITVATRKKINNKRNI